jgi:hypothetical protein
MTLRPISVAGLVVFAATTFLSWSNHALHVVLLSNSLRLALCIAFLLIGSALGALAGKSVARLLFVAAITLTSGFMFLVGLWLVVAFVAALGLLLAVVATIRAPWRQRALGAMVLFASIVAGAAVGTPLGLRTWETRLAGVARSGAPLVEAIQAFQREAGVPPMNLADLVPRYLEAVPDTGLSGMGGGATWLYRTAPFLVDTEKRRFGGNAWVLEVQTGTRGRGYLEMIYLPDQKYPAKVTRVGGWAITPW